MKKFHFTLFALLSSYCVIAQEYRKPFWEDENGWIHLNMGIAIPTGMFANQNENLRQAGLANTGFIFKGDLAIKAYKNIGIVLSGYRGTNSTNISAEGEIEPWIYFGATGGIYFKLSSKTVSFILKTQTGYMNANNYGYLEMSGSYRRVKESRSADALVFTAGSGVAFNITKKASFMLSADYMTANPKFEDVKEVRTKTSNNIIYYSTTDPVNIIQPIQVVSLNIGLFFSLGDY